MPLFEAIDLNVSYERVIDNSSDEVRASVQLQHVNFALEAGTISDLIGPSGNGKSMLFRALTLMMERQGGTLLLEGRSDTSFSPCEWRRNVCLVPQQVALISGTVRDNLLLPWSFKVNAGRIPPNDTELSKILEAALLDFDLDHDSAKLSGGQAARIALIRSLITRPKVLLLDEVDAALDDDSARAIGTLIARTAERGSACFRIRHRPPDGFSFKTYQLSNGALEIVNAHTSTNEDAR